MGQRPSAKSVSNFVIFLLILQNCGRARTQRTEQTGKAGGRDGLAKFEFSAHSAHRAEAVAEEVAEEALHVFNFAKIYKSLYGYARANPSAKETEGRARQWQSSVGRVVSRRPFHVLEQLQQDLEEKLKRTTTVKPFSVLQQLALDHQQLQQQQQHHSPQSNASFHILEALQKDWEMHDSRTTTPKPFRVLQQLDVDLEEANRHTTTMKPFQIVHAHMEEAVKKHQHYLEAAPQEEEEEEESFEVLEPIAEELEVQEQHKGKGVPQGQGRAKDSQKRKRKRIRRRRKRIRRRRRKKRKKKRKKRKKKKKKNKGDKKKKRKKRGRRKKQKPTQAPLFQPAQLIFANPTKQPHYYHHHSPHYAHATYLTTKPPATTKRPFSKIKDLLRHNSLFKKKKKEYLSHVGQVLYPFVKFVAFFTVLNPFTLGVFLFTLVSPAVFGFLGFVALSVLVKPFLNLVFGVKQNVDAFDRKRFLANKRAERLKLALRPVTIHKHYYQQKPLGHAAPPLKLRPVGGHWRRESAPPRSPRPPAAALTASAPAPAGHRKHFNPLLPDQREALDMDFDYV